MANIKKLPDGRYQVDWTEFTGKRNRHILSNKTEAQKLYNTLCGQKLFEITGIDPSLGQKADNFRKLTFKELAERYVNEHLKFSGAAGNASYVRTLIAKWGSWRLPLITNAQARPWIYSCLRQGVNGKQWEVSSVRKLTAYFIRVFNWAVSNEIIPKNPLAGLIEDKLSDELKKVNKRTKTMEPEEFWALIEGWPRWIQRVCIAAWCTGMRDGEIISLRHKQIDHNKRVFYYQPGGTKERDAKTVGMEQELVDVLAEIATEREILAITEGKEISPEDFVFLSSKGKQVDQTNLEHRFRKLADAKGYTDLVIHDFRHSYTTRKRREGHDREIIKAQTGHHSDSMFDWYNRVDETEIQELNGYSKGNLDLLKADLEKIVGKARENGIPLGAVQGLIGRMWRVVA